MNEKRVLSISLFFVLVAGLFLAASLFGSGQAKASPLVEITFNQTGVKSDFTGIILTVDGNNYNWSHLPVSFWWCPGSTHYFAYQSPLVVRPNAKRYLWTCTNGLSTHQNGSITVCTSGNVTGNYKTQYYLTVTSAHDSPTPTSGWFDCGSKIKALVTSPVSGGSGTQYVCTGWTGTGSVPGSGSTTTVTFTIVAPSSITWNWKTQYQVNFSQTGVGIDFTGTVFTVDGTNYTRSDSPVFWWDSGSTHTFMFQSPLVVPPGVEQDVWTGTIGLSSMQGGSIIVTSSGSIVGNYETQDYLTLDSNPSGVGNQTGGGWYGTGSSALISTDQQVIIISGESQYKFTGWTTNNMAEITDPTSASTTVLVDEPKTVTANYAIQYAVTFGQTGVGADFTGTVFTVDGANHIFSDSPTFWWDNGSSHTFAFDSPLVVAANSEQYLWTNTSGLSTLQNGSLTVASSGNVTGNYKTQYYLTVASLYDSPSPTSGWFDAGSNINADVTSPVSGGPGTQYVCTGWTGTGSVPGSGSTTTVTFTIVAPSNITWNWKIQYQVNFSQTGVGTDFTGNVVNVDGVNYTLSSLPVSFWWDQGSSHSFVFGSPLEVNASEQYVWNSTSGLSTLQSGSLTVTASGNVDGNYMVQYQVTFDQVGVGSDFVGSVVLIDGVNYSRTQLPAPFWYDGGSTHSFAFQTPLVGGTATYDWNSTTGLSTLQSASINVAGPGNVTGFYATSLQGVVVTNTTAPSWTYQDILVIPHDCVNISVSVQNTGASAEEVWVTLFYDIAANKTVGAYPVLLESGENYTLIFVWNTAWVPCGNYTLTAVVATPTSSNTFTVGNIVVRIVGDVNSDGRVDVKDIALVARAFGSKPGSINWNPAADVNGDGVVNMKDIALIARYFGRQTKAY
ncbi:MAG: dockerin type I domain-containing protein [Candidatus Bathyarchaeia archaeon]|jgi:hypothetical protein